MGAIGVEVQDEAKPLESQKSRNQAHFRPQLSGGDVSCSTHSSSSSNMLHWASCLETASWWPLESSILQQ